MKLPKTNKCPSEPDFSLYAHMFEFTTNKQWTHCREIFHRRLTRNEAFYFKSRSYAACIRRIKKLEKAMGIKSKAKFYRTRLDNVIYVRLGKFWSFNSLRKSVFTAVLKRGHSYYFRSGKPARIFQMFMKGYVNQTRRYCSSWGVIGNTLYNYKIRRRPEISELIRK